jgi:ribonuclease-3
LHIHSILLNSLYGIIRYAFSGNKKLSQSLKNVLGFYPVNISLYHQAFRHKSTVSKDGEKTKASNERLEYLGDAVLGAVVAELLFKKFPFKDEGFLTEMRSKIVSRENLNRLAIKLGIIQFIETGQDGNAKNRSMNGDAFEALIGAIYLDKGYDTTAYFITKRIIKVHIDIEELVATENNFKSRLIEWAQKEKKVVIFEVVEEIGNPNHKQIKVQVLIDAEAKGFGIDFSKKKAEQIAATEACKNLEI